MENQSASLDPGTQRDICTELARLVIEQAAPDELMVFDEVAEEYFDRPMAVLNPRHRDESLGFGLELTLLAPFVLAIAGEVVRVLGDLLAETFKDETKPVLSAHIRRIFKRPARQPAEAKPLRLTPEQMRSVHAAALGEGRRLKLSEETTALLGNAIVGALLVGPPNDGP